MKKIVLLITLSIVALLSYAQCVPDPNWNTDGISPSRLPDASIGTNYSTIISFKTPKDTSFFYGGETRNATIDSAMAEVIKNVPPGFTWACNNSTCSWKGGEKGCALLSGKADSNNLNHYEIKVFIRSWVTIAGLGFQVERLDSSTIDFYVTGGKSSVQNLIPTPKFSFYPNPAKNVLYIESQNLVEKNSIVTISDLLGKSLKIKELQCDSAAIDIADLPKGMYLINFSNSNFSNSQKLIIE
jgi:hypothetical protein